ncbi:MAG: hypothetical protein ACOX8U_05705 [Bradymonadia bacterium]|jgi:hypothetical protein
MKLRLIKNTAFCMAIALAPIAIASNATAQESIGSKAAQLAQTNDITKRLPEKIEAKFKAIRSDPDPANLVRNAHYWISNENAHYVWYPHIKNKGGVLSGVGTDQVYLLAAWSKPIIIVPLDFDREITRLHFAYGAAFMSAETPEAFIALWNKKNDKDMIAAIQAHFPDEAKAIEKAYKGGRSNVYSRLNRVAKKYNKLEIPTFLTTQESYDYIRKLWLNGRVFPVCGDLTADSAMLDMGKAIKDSSLNLEVFYPSNAEHYFPYDAKYRRNILALPFGETGLILRTRQMNFLGLAEEGDYHYNMQTGENFKYWLEKTNIADQYKMLRQRTKTDNPGLSIMDKVPEAASKAPQIAEMP